MERVNVQGHQSTHRVARSTRLLIPLALGVGILLGGILVSRFGGPALSPYHPGAAAAEPAKRVAPEGLPDVVQVELQSQKDVGIAVEPAALRTLQGSLSATGVVREDPARVAHVRTLARGLIEKIYAKLGERVSAGAPLVEYDNIELGMSIGEYQSAQAELRQSLTDLDVKAKIAERSRAMLKVGAVAQNTHDLREAEVKDAEAKVEAARANVSKIEEQIHRFGLDDEALGKVLSQWTPKAHTVSHSIVRAPFAGVVTSQHAVGSEVVEEGTELLAVTDMSSLWVLADVYEKDLSQVRTGQAVRVRVGSYPQQTFSGKITYIGDIIDPKTRTAKVRCVVDNQSGLLKLEMFATVEIPAGHTGLSLVVPSSSVQQIDGRSVVFVRTSETAFQKREVQTGLESEGYTEIRAGVQPGEAVVNRGSFVVKTAFLKHLIGGDE